MGGIRGKSARKRARMAQNTKTFDRIPGRFYDEQVAMPKGKVSENEMLSAPKSFRRFLAAKAAAESREKRREREENEQEDEPAAASGYEKGLSDGDQSSSEDEDGDEGDQRKRTTDVTLSFERNRTKATPNSGSWMKKRRRKRLKIPRRRRNISHLENAKEKSARLSALRKRKSLSLLMVLEPMFGSEKLQRHRQPSR